MPWLLGEGMIQYIAHAKGKKEEETCFHAFSALAKKYEFIS